MPAANYLTAEVALVDRPVGGLEEDDNPTKQRRYYVKSGRYVDYEEEVLASRSVSAQAVIFDKTPSHALSGAEGRRAGKVGDRACLIDRPHDRPG